MRNCTKSTANFAGESLLRKQKCNFDLVVTQKFVQKLNKKDRGGSKFIKKLKLEEKRKNFSERFKINLVRNTRNIFGS
jgi:hypothetical protein